MEDDKLSPTERGFVTAITKFPDTVTAMESMLLSEIDYLTKLIVRPEATPRAVDLNLGRIDQCKRLLKRLKM